MTRSAAQKPPSTEIELRLTGKPAALRAAFDSPCMKPGPGQTDRTTELDNRYVDTRDFRLRSRGLAYRVRNAGGHYRQTLKSGDDAKSALLRRGEWETPLDDGRPVPEALPKTAATLLAEAAGDAELSEVFRTRLRRRTRRLLVDDAGGERGPNAVEAVLDLGRIETGAGSIAIAEIELELVEGRPRALYRLALDLLEVAPLQLETRSKSGRAYDLLTGGPLPRRRTKPPSLDPGADIDDAMAAIFGTCRDHWLANQAAALDGRHPEGVHQMRVGLRRLRSALAMFRRLIPTDQLAWLRPGVKLAIDGLGGARDWDVLLAEIVVPVAEALPDEPTLPILADRVKQRGRSHHRAMLKTIKGADYTRFALRFCHWLEERDWRRGRDTERERRAARPPADLAARMLNKRHLQALALGDGLAGLGTAERHRLRIAIKKLRYGVEFFAPLFGRKSARPFLKSLKTLQDDLGYLNDLTVAETLLGRLLATNDRRHDRIDLARAAGIVIGWHARGLAAREPAILQSWAAFTKRRTFWR